jgi:uncharacterized protein (DUF1697 family)
VLSIVLLRRINVTGGHLTMAALVATFARAGYPDASSVLASGNVIVASDDLVDGDLIVESVRLDHGFETEAFIRTQSELAKVVEVSPFDGAEAKIEVVFMHNPLSAGAKAALSDIAVGPDQLVAVGREIHWRRPLPLSELVPKERQSNRSSVATPPVVRWERWNESSGRWSSATDGRT